MSIEDYSPMEKELHKSAYQDAVSYAVDIWAGKSRNERERLNERLTSLSVRGEHIYMRGYQMAINDLLGRVDEKRKSKLEENLP